MGKGIAALVASLAIGTPFIAASPSTASPSRHARGPLVLVNATVGPPIGDVVAQGEPDEKARLEEEARLAAEVAAAAEAARVAAEAQAAAEAARIAAEEQARRAVVVPTRAPAAPTPAVAPTPVSSTGGSCYASALPAYIVSRESGGDPTIVNGGGHAASPYVSGGRAWGCFQFMPATWNANCADLGYSVADQVTCANRVSRGGTNLGPWAG